MKNSERRLIDRGKTAISSLDIHHFHGVIERIGIDSVFEHNCCHPYFTRLEADDLTRK